MLFRSGEEDEGGHGEESRDLLFPGLGELRVMAEAAREGARSRGNAGDWRRWGGRHRVAAQAARSRDRERKIEGAGEVRGAAAAGTVTQMFVSSA